jgi:hypothetical protein
MPTNNNNSELLQLIHRAIDAFCLSTAMTVQENLDEIERVRQKLVTELQNLHNDITGTDPAVILQRLVVLGETFEELSEAAAGLGNDTQQKERPLHNIATALRKHYGVKERPEDIAQRQENYKK